METGAFVSEFEGGQGLNLFSSFLTLGQSERSDFKSTWILSKCFVKSDLAAGLISTVSPLQMSVAFFSLRCLSRRSFGRMMRLWASTFLVFIRNSSH